MLSLHDSILLYRSTYARCQKAVNTACAPDFLAHQLQHGIRLHGTAADTSRTFTAGS